MKNKSQVNIQLIIMAKAPLAGLAKTRLIAAIGEQESARLAESMLYRTIAQAQIAGIGTIELCVTPSKNSSVWSSLDIPKGIVVSNQVDGDLGERMSKAMLPSLSQGKAAIVIGTDCPALDASCLRDAGNSLATYDCCLTPADDGGYVLLGLKHISPNFFIDIPWSTPEVCRLTEQRILAAGKSLKRFNSLKDIDTADDLIYLPPELRSRAISKYLE